MFFMNKKSIAFSKRLPDDKETSRFAGHFLSQKMELRGIEPLSKKPFIVLLLS